MSLFKRGLGGVGLTLLSLGIMWLGGVVEDKKMEKMIAEEVDKAVSKRLG